MKRSVASAGSPSRTSAPYHRLSRVTTSPIRAVGEDQAPLGPRERRSQVDTPPNGHSPGRVEADLVAGPKESGRPGRISGHAAYRHGAGGHDDHPGRVGSVVGNGELGAEVFRDRAGGAHQEEAMGIVGDGEVGLAVQQQLADGPAIPRGVVPEGAARPQEDTGAVGELKLCPLPDRNSYLSERSGHRCQLTRTGPWTGSTRTRHPVPATQRPRPRPRPRPGRARGRAAARHAPVSAPSALPGRSRATMRRHAAGVSHVVVGVAATCQAARSCSTSRVLAGSDSIHRWISSASPRVHSPAR